MSSAAAPASDPRPRGPSILLHGPPGVGKSTLLPELAQKANLPAADLDDEIQQRTGRSAAQHIEEDGEASFRATEAEVLATLADRPRVIALGGGAMTHRPTRECARRLGFIVRLGLDRAAHRARLERDDSPRPLLQNLDTLMAERRAVYQVGDLAIDTGRPPAAVADEILAVLKARHVRSFPFDLGESRVQAGAGLSDAAAGALAHLGPRRPTVLLEDEGVPAKLREAYRAALGPAAEAGGGLLCLSVEGGEASKSWASLGALLVAATEGGAGRQSVVIGIGGGATCDVAGFLASVLGRGAPLILVPTTVLSQVDAAVGGKTAVNLATGRNLVGTFWAARDVLLDTDFHASLSPRELRSGLAEVLKMGLIRDAELFHSVVDDGTASAAAIWRAAELKGEVVLRDPREAGERKELNLGHTLGHALESASDYALAHGEAVAIGTAAIARWCAAEGALAPDAATAIIHGLQKLGLPTEAPAHMLKQAAPWIRQDKKGNHREIDVIALEAIGRCVQWRRPLEEVTDHLVRWGGHHEEA